MHRNRFTKLARAVVFVAAALVMIGGCSGAPESEPIVWDLVWSDDFDGEVLDPNKWAVYTGRYGTPPRLQLYAPGPSNVAVTDGRLVLRATHDPETDSWDSGMVYTNDVREPANDNWVKGNLGWQYGRFEVRAKLPYARGAWPAIWMRPLDQKYPGEWPHNGEIDILEYLGPQGNSADAPIESHLSNLHFVGTDGTNRQDRGEVPVDQVTASDWHVYAVEWQEGALRFFVDDEQVHEVTSWASQQGYPAPFDQRFDIIINLQVGHWAGDPVPADFPAQLEIDWVRVYEAQPTPGRSD